MARGFVLNDQHSQFEGPQEGKSRQDMYSGRRGRVTDMYWGARMARVTGGHSGPGMSGSYSSLRSGGSCGAVARRAAACHSSALEVEDNRPWRLGDQ